MKKGGAVLPPVVNLKSRKDDSEESQAPILGLGPKVCYFNFEIYLIDTFYNFYIVLIPN